MTEFTHSLNSDLFKKLRHLQFLQCLDLFPGPLEIDQENDQNNILINETVWMKLVQWYGKSLNTSTGRKEISRCSTRDESKGLIKISNPISHHGF